MRIVNRQSRITWIHRFIIPGLIFLGALHSALTVQAQVAAPKVLPAPSPPPVVISDYSLAVPTITIEYQTQRNWNGVTTLANGAPASQNPDLKINWQNTSGVAPTDAILLKFEFHYQGVPFTYTTAAPILRNNQTYYSFNLTTLASQIVSDLNNRLPRDFNPNTPIILDGTVAVTVTPLLPPSGLWPRPPIPAANKGTPTRTTSDLIIVFQPVVNGTI